MLMLSDEIRILEHDKSHEWSPYRNSTSRRDQHANTALRPVDIGSLGLTAYSREMYKCLAIQSKWEIAVILREKRNTSWRILFVNETALSRRDILFFAE